MLVLFYSANIKQKIYQIDLQKKIPCISYIHGIYKVDLIIN